MAAIVISMFLFLLACAEVNVSQGQLYGSSLSFYRGNPPDWNGRPNNKYQYLQFVLQKNPKSVDITEMFTIHGLWPTNKTRPTNKRKIHGKTVRLQSVDYCHYRGYNLPQDLEDKLNIFWPNVEHCSKNEGFWKYQYKKHGSCTNPILGSPESYFKAALRLHNQVMKDVINHSGIQPGTPFHARSFSNKFVIGGIKVEPLLLCGKCGQSQQLDEIVICFKAKARTPIDCPKRDQKLFCHGYIHL